MQPDILISSRFLVVLVTFMLYRSRFLLSPASNSVMCSVVDKLFVECFNGVLVS